MADPTRTGAPFGPVSCRWSADPGSQVSALGVGLPSGAPFRCKHRIAHRKRAPLSTRTLRCSLPIQLSMPGAALLALVAFFLPTATLASTKKSGACMHGIGDFLGSSPATRSNQSHQSHPTYYPGSKEGHIPTRSASEGSGAFPSLARRVNMQQHAELPCRGNNI